MIIFHQYFDRVKLQLKRKTHIAGWNMTAHEAATFIHSLRKTVLTFVGYSGMGYEDENAMLQIAREVLSQCSPKTTLINIGVTCVGIGAIYPLAKSMGFETSGIVTNLALKRPDDISSAVDHICFIKDSQWGGKLPNSEELSPTSRAMVSCSDILVGIGGGRIANVEMQEGKKQGKPTQLFPAEMNHERAIQYAKYLGVPSPTTFSGSFEEIFKIKTLDS